MTFCFSTKSWRKQMIANNSLLRKFEERQIQCTWVCLKMVYISNNGILLGKITINHRIFGGILFSDKPWQTHMVIDWVPDNQHEANAKSGDEGGASPYLETCTDRMTINFLALIREWGELGWLLIVIVIIPYSLLSTRKSKDKPLRLDLGSLGQTHIPSYTIQCWWVH